MSLPNPIVFVQFHPVTYMVKLNIEMSMATLITKVAKGSGESDETTESHNVSLSYAKNQSKRGTRLNIHHTYNDNVPMKTYHTTAVGTGGSEEDLEMLKGNSNGIHRRLDVRVESTTNSETECHDFEKALARSFDRREDEMSLTHHPGHPRGTIK